MKNSIYHNGNIITLEDNLYCEAVLTQDGKIKKIGTLQEILKLKTEETVMYDLKGMTMIPSFIDSHSHITSYAQSLSFCNLSECYSLNDIKNTLIMFKEKSNIKEDKLIIGFGYDQNSLEEGRHPNKFDLEETNIKNPILISHVSGHMGVLNQRALETFNITPQNQDQTNGYLEESAFIKIASNLKMPNISELEHLLKKSEQIYASYGITTAQDGFIKKDGIELLKSCKLSLDVVGFIDLKSAKELSAEYKEFIKRYKNKFKIGGYKIFLDGSPQGRTAWMTKPYQGSDDGYCGYPIYKDKEVTNFIVQAIKDEVQILAHCNGDAAAEQYINCIKEAIKLTGKNPLRPVMIHAQLLRLDLIKELKELGIIPSYFVAHTYFWGDTHIKNFGQRGYNICPTNSTKKDGVIFTLHQDSPVIEPNMIMTIWCACNRETKNKEKLNQDECISVLDALKATTINAAYQYFEEDIKGSIKEGKNADFTILSQDILKTKPKDIRDIKIITTIKDDEVIYTSK